MFYGEQKKKKCIGTYRVSGYTREDGTKVSSYMRTCGAKHEGKDTAEKTKEEYTLTDDEREYARKQEYYNDIYNRMTYDMSFANVQEKMAKYIPINIPFIQYYHLSVDYDKEKSRNKDNAYQVVRDINDKYLQELLMHSSEWDIYGSTDVVIPQYNSPLYKAVVNSPEIKKLIKDNINKIQNGQCEKKFLNLSFKQNLNTHLVLGKAKLYNAHVVGEYVYGTLVDYYDFNELSYGEKRRENIIVYANNNAYRQQQLKRLRNYLIIMPVRIYAIP